ncbi:MAG: CBS domain-containing protein, partial [Chitinivibrionales bacterium]|nr:CBS domain-containing protein [Chitinivibrionales bacterium]
MIPKEMQKFLTHAVSSKMMQTRLIHEGSYRYLEFTSLDINGLAHLGVKVDWLGPYLVVCMWDEQSPVEIGGYLVVDNLTMGKPSMGGIRMLPTITPSLIYNLARGMTLKNAAATLPFGGGKSGIVAPPDLAGEERTAVVRGFARMLNRYRTIYNPGPDVGTNDADMRTIAIENGLDNTLSKPVGMGGTCIDLFGGAAGGVVTAVATVLNEFPKLKRLPQFRDLQIPHWGELTVLVQGFGAVGANTAKILQNHDSAAKPRIVGISDQDGHLFCESGLPVEKLFTLWEEHKVVVIPFAQEQLLCSSKKSPITFSNDPNRLLREAAFCFIPAAPIANYLYLDKSTNPSITIDQIGKWAVVVEGANTYSPDPELKAARLRLERVAYRDKAILFVQDYLVNSGGVIFAAQERLIPTPNHLHIPQDYLGDSDKVDQWLADHSEDFAELSEKRAASGMAMRDRVISHNIIELVGLLVSDANMLPCEAAEKISLNRIEQKEKARTVGEVMIPIRTITENSTIFDAARVLVESNSDIVCVVDGSGKLSGVVTDWDITRSAAQKNAVSTPISSIISRVS